jgi:hypothetical protein
MPISTLTTKGIVAAFRARLLNFVPIGGGATLNTRLGGRLYKDRPADNAPFPYGIVTVGPRVSDGMHHGEREAFDVELQIWHSPRSDMEWVAEELADIADQAMLRWRDASGGAIACVGRLRQTVPIAPIGSPVDRENIQIIIRFEMRAWPQLLTQYAAA